MPAFQAFSKENINKTHIIYGGHVVQRINFRVGQTSKHKKGHRFRQPLQYYFYYIIIIYYGGKNTDT